MTITTTDMYMMFWTLVFIAMVYIVVFGCYVAQRIAYLNGWVEEEEEDDPEEDEFIVDGED